MEHIFQDENGTWKLEEYLKYLQSIRDRLPANAKLFAFLDGHYDISHQRCPHDSWVEFVSVREHSEGVRKQIRTLDIIAKFLNSYHDGFFEITYKNVKKYSLKLDRVHRKLFEGDTEDGPKIGHGDWIIDEILLDDFGNVIHEIEFSDSGLWKIVCEDIIYDWVSQPN